MFFIFSYWGLNLVVLYYWATSQSLKVSFFHFVYSLDIAGCLQWISTGAVETQCAVHKKKYQEKRAGSCTVWKYYNWDKYQRLMENIRGKLLQSLMQRKFFLEEVLSNSFKMWGKGQSVDGEEVIGLQHNKGFPNRRSEMCLCPRGPASHSPLWKSQLAQKVWRPGWVTGRGWESPLVSIEISFTS